MTKVPLALALSGCSSQFLGLLSANIPATHLLSLGFILLNVGDQPWRWSLRDGCVTTSLSTQQNSFQRRWKRCDTPAWWDGDEMMFLISCWCQQLVTLVLQMNTPGSFPLSPHFPVPGSRTEQTALLSVPALLLLFTPFMSLSW